VEEAKKMASENKKNQAEEILQKDESAQTHQQT
jgi:hypothetical protein